MTVIAETDPVAGRTAQRRRLVPLIVASALFMEQLDATIIATALPAMAASFGTTPAALSLGITSYMLALAAFVPLSGWAADRYGTRNVLAAAIAMFVVASVLCGLSDQLPTFIAARILQGASAAMMSPVGRLVVLRGTPKSELMNAITWLTWPALVAPVIGPALGGLFVGYLSWHWIFFVNVPVGGLGLVLVARFVPNLRHAQSGAFDWRGLVLTGTALACLLMAFDLLAHAQSAWMWAVLLLAAGVPLGWAALRHAAHAPNPVVSAAALHVRSFRASTIAGGGAFRMTAGAMPFLLPLVFQLGFGMSALGAGLMVLAYAAGNLGMKAIALPVVRRFGFRTTLVANGLLAAAGILGCAMLSPQTPLPVTVTILFLAGSLRSLQLTGLATLTYVDIEPGIQSSATTLASMLQPISMSLGVALCAAFLSVVSGTGPTAALSLWDFQLALVGLAMLAAVSVISFIRLPSDVGAEVAGRQPAAGKRA